MSTTPPPNIIGIDPGMRKVCLTASVAGGPWVSERFTYGRTSPTDRLFELRKLTDEWQRAYADLAAPTVLALEAPMGLLQGNSRWLPVFWWEISTMFEHRAAAYHDASSYAHEWEMGNPPALLCLDPAPAVLKKFVTDKGNANKSMMTINIVRQWEDELPPVLAPAVAEGDYSKIEDELESFALARMAELAWEITTGEAAPHWHAYQVEAVVKCLGSTARMVVPRSECR